ncbi:MULTISPECIES: carbohydrate ABC transporter permease [Mahella]|uniref:Carbohydrate ABC transporter membrane protein 2, CUT1 family n=1 Tax=Mahella australiensis (strain DSM 15567 / CIP 107919 / 50-1 BON) TaxID=697281 RepID=F3ZWQ8_MAHA5|nr:MULTISPECIES: carbohydrate ABC transporter permease [Mahella]AEE96501.1 carbohydrate ABC transporter membrane protein 2, CUT1 family [Mahella australiensis 50-1 BON]MBZ4664828.1 carbohydrate transporter rane protein 2, family [Mahella sp.]
MKVKQRRNLLMHFLIILFGLIMIYPLIWMLSASFKEDVEIFQSTSLLPKNPTLNNYIYGWKGVSGVSFGKFFINSFFLAIVSIIANILSCSMAAYAFSKLEFRFKNTLFAIMLVTLMLPFHVRLIPQYIVFSKIGWVNTYLPLLVPKFFATEGFFIFLLVQFMRGISNELLEAPRIDGAGTFRIYMQFIMPLSVPALVTVAIFTFIWTWNDFFSQMIYLSAPPTFTVSLALRMFVDATGESSWGALFAMSCLSLVPLLFIFIVFQRYLVEGIMLGSIKG